MSTDKLTLEHDRDTWKIRALAAEQVLGELHERNARMKAMLEECQDAIDAALRASEGWLWRLEKAKDKLAKFIEEEFGDEGKTVVKECELCGKPATHFCECSECGPGRYLCDACGGPYRES